jgi:hypothetical protein
VEKKKKNASFSPELFSVLLNAVLSVDVVQSRMCGISIAQYLLLLVIKRQTLLKGNGIAITTKPGDQHKYSLFVF